MDVTNQLIQVLEKTISPDTHELESAQQYLEAASATNLVALLTALSDILKDVSKTDVARMQAGLQLKNAIHSKDPVVKAQHQQRWLSFDENIRNHIKANVLHTIGTEKIRPSSAAQCVAYIACAELPHNLWLDLIKILTNNVTLPQSTEMMKEAALEAIGYICQDIDPEILQPQSNDILTAIVHAMRKEEPSNNVRYAATTALLNSLEFTRANFEKEDERNLIMQVVCEATQSPDTKVRVAALQNLVKIMSLYYIHMTCYMNPALFPITLDAMNSENDEIALQGIEFWSTVCDEEVDLAIELSEAREQGRPPERTSMFYAKGALRHLWDILQKSLQKQEEFDDDDDWNPCKAAGVCLMLLATCCEDDVVFPVLEFVRRNIDSNDWKARDAAVMSFGSILEGPDPDKLKPTVQDSMPFLIKKLNDPSVVVRDSAAWTVGRVCEILPEPVLNEAILIQEHLLDALIKGLDAEPRVASNVCWAFSSLAEAAYENAVDDGEGPKTYCLSKFFQTIVERLLHTTDRTDANQHNLRNAAYEALMELVKNSPLDCYNIVSQTTLIILDRLEKVKHMEGAIQSSNDRVQYNDLQSLLCATLQSVLRKVTPEDAPKISDKIMFALLGMFDPQNKTGGVQEDALLAMSTLIEVLGKNYNTFYMDAFKPHLYLSLKNFAEYQVCLAAVGIVGDLCRALGSDIIVHCEEMMLLLLENLGNESVHRSVKPQILSVFGDIALAIGSNFKAYLDVVMNTLQQASQAQVDKSDYDMIDYLNELREGCLEAYTGIVQGLRGDTDEPNPDIALVQPHVNHIVSFIEFIALDDDKSESNVAACCGLIGDLCSAYGAFMLPLVDRESISNLLQQGRRTKSAKSKALATWATKEIRRLKNLPSS